MKNKQKLLFPVLVVVILFGVYFFRFQRQLSYRQNSATPVITVSPTQEVVSDQFQYQGQDGIDALTLLKQKTPVEQDKSGMVVSISGRLANNNQREFWAFYINGESAQVGPASYITKNNDIIIWKIEKY